MIFCLQVDSFVTDLVDGTILVELVQALTGERLFGTVSCPQCAEDAVANIQVVFNGGNRLMYYIGAVKFWGSVTKITTGSGILKFADTFSRFDMSLTCSMITGIPECFGS